MDLLVDGEGNGDELDLLGGGCGSLHGLNERLQGKPESFFERQVFLVLLLEEGIGGNVVAADGRGLPPGIVARRISGVELELAVLVVAGEEEGRSERPGSSDLGVVLLDIADVDNDFLDGDGGSVLEPVVLNECGDTCAYSLSKLMR